MSTRATYLFTSPKNKPVCFYIHSDGFPKGAARYFYHMHQCKKIPGDFAAKFKCAVDPEVTPNHGAHWDTQYRYTLGTDGTLKAWERQSSADPGKWKLFFNDKWFKFVNEFLDIGIKLYLFKIDECTSEIMTVCEALSKVIETKMDAIQALNAGETESLEFLKLRIKFIQDQIYTILKEDPLLEIELKDSITIKPHESIKEFSITWGIIDVLEMRPDLTEEQAIIVLQKFEDGYDCGSDSQVLEFLCDELYPTEV